MVVMRMRSRPAAVLELYDNFADNLQAKAWKVSTRLHCQYSGPKITSLEISGLLAI